MYVVASIESLNHVLISTQMSHNSKLYLGVVGREKDFSRLGNKGLTNFATIFAAHGDILQVRIGRTEASRGRNGLIERGMDVSCGRIDEFWKGFNVGGKKLFESAIIQYLLHDRMFRMEIAQHLLAGGILPALGLLDLFREFQFAEKHFSHLSWRVDSEFVSRQFVDILF